MEQKAEIDNATVDEGEIRRIMTQFGLEPIKFEKMRGGFSSCNVRVRCKNGDGEEQTVVLKLANEDHSLEDIQLQVRILEALQPKKFPTNYLRPLSSGRGYIADERMGIVLDFMTGTPGDKLLAMHAADTQSVQCIMEGLGGTLATLHNCDLEAELAPVRDIRCGFPVSNTGDLLLPGKMEEVLKSPIVANHEFALFVLERLARVRELYDRAEKEGALQVGLIHGDAFLDNTIYNTESLQVEALLDWEDACTAPFIVDVAACIAGNCFCPDSNGVDLGRVQAILKGYTAIRSPSVSPEELTMLPDFVWAALLACGCWRFVNFNVDKPQSPESAKASYKGMYERLKILEAMGPGAWAVQH